jgi:hypothetical protein
MKKYVLLISATLAAGFAANADGIDEEIQENVKFYLSFDGTIEADRATGTPQAVNAARIKQPNFEKGIKGKALLAKDKSISLSFKRKDNLVFSEAGSVSFWIKPIKWKVSDEMPINKKSGFRKCLYSNFFLTAYSKNGYLGFERITSPHPGHLSRMLLFFANIKGVRAGGSTKIDWAKNPGTWHNVVITWSPRTFKVYLDGAFKYQTTLQRRLEDNDLSSNFHVVCPPDTALDEFIIYGKELPAADVLKFYKALFKDNK